MPLTEEPSPFRGRPGREAVGLWTRTVNHSNLFLQAQDPEALDVAGSIPVARSTKSNAQNGLRLGPKAGLCVLAPSVHGACS